LFSAFIFLTTGKRICTASLNQHKITALATSLRWELLGLTVHPEELLGHSELAQPVGCDIPGDYSIFHQLTVRLDRAGVVKTPRVMLALPCLLLG